MRKFVVAVVMGVALYVAAPAVTPAWFLPHLPIKILSVKCSQGVEGCSLALDHRHISGGVIVLGDKTELWKLLTPFPKEKKKGSTLHGREYGPPPNTPLWRL